MHAAGTFEVKVMPAEVSEIGKEAGLGRYSIDKVWDGAIEGTSKGEMTTTAIDKLMVYIALETMKVKVDGRSGSFVLWHRATMMPENPAGAFLEVAVVPDSGSGDLKGIEGRLAITIDKSGHHYDLEYTLPAH